VKEVLRLYPAIPVFPREAAADDVLPSGHPVSAGEPGVGVGSCVCCWMRWGCYMLWSKRCGNNALLCTAQ
jgi:hypothetical protein